MELKCTTRRTFLSISVPDSHHYLIDTFDPILRRDVLQCARLARYKLKHSDYAVSITLYQLGSLQSSSVGLFLGRMGPKHTRSSHMWNDQLHVFRGGTRNKLPITQS